MKFGILDHLSECSVEAKILGPEAIIHCYVCTDETQLPEQISELASAMVWHEITLSERTLRRLDLCRALVRVGVGYDNIDLACAGELGIPVVNIPDYGTNDVADHTMALLLALARKLPVYDAAVRADPAGNWKHDFAGDVFDFLHHFFVDVEAACGIDDDEVFAGHARLVDAFGGEGDGVCAGAVVDGDV